MLELGHTCAGIYEPDNVALAAHFSNTYQIPVVDDVNRLLASDVDLVGCAAINNEKISIIELCEKHGRHVMIDKPAVTNREDLQRLEAVLNRGAIQVGMLLTERFRSSLYTLKQIIEQGQLGRVLNITMRKPHRLTPTMRPSWHFSKEQNGGIVIDLFIHDFDLLRWLTGQEPVSASGYMAKSILPEHPTFYDRAGLQVVMDGQVTAQLYADWHNPERSWTWGDCRLFVTGTQGSAELRLEGDPFVSKDDLLLVVTHEEELRRAELLQPPSSITADFLNRIEGGTGVITHRDIWLATKATIEADQEVQLIHE
ncbi:Gfo/Idh/MocA family oxidoreductase [Paenibacillus cremeus]|uniref:Gfo/Idh/MocA family oxidoreductase n=2 Tax=Paenibacillus cremeus TaxID=2163881 RepID=A0A559K7Q4_9BACL|nr:Gfo/Idh/MocA family oxidoreductase [Paenibacillus cremeus]